MKILVDGSNVLFWRGGQADRQAPTLVARALIACRFAPMIYFDHSIYRHLSQAALETLGELAETVIASQGTSADALLLEACERGRAQVVSCDRFRDWRSHHPGLKADWLVTGRIEKGARVSFSKKLRRPPL